MTHPPDWNSREYPAYIEQIERRQDEGIRREHARIVERLAEDSDNGLVPISILIWEQNRAYEDGYPVCDSRTSLPPDSIARIMDVYYSECRALTEKRPHLKMGGISW